MAGPGDARINEKELEKTAKSFPWQKNIKIVLVVIGAVRKIPKDLGNYVCTLEINGITMHQLEKAVLLGSAPGLGYDPIVNEINPTNDWWVVYDGKHYGIYNDND